MRKTVFLLAVLLYPLCSLAQSRADKLPPKWLYGHVPGTTPSIEFKTVRVPYAGYGDVSASALGALVQKWGEETLISQTAELKSVDTLERENGSLVRGSQQQVSTLSVLAEGKPVSLKCMLVDEWVHKQDGWKEYCAVYQLALRPDARFVPCEVTSRYGAGPVFMSLFPGAGQFYKGDSLKGGLLRGRCVLGTAGAIFLESRRKAFASQREQTHDVNLIKQYAASEKNLGIARNVTIGVTAALYLYNLIDAAIAPGAKRIQVTGSGVSYSF